MPHHPSLFQINTRVWLRRLSREAGRRISLAEIDEATFDDFADKGFDWICSLSVWQTGAAGRAVFAQQSAMACRVRIGAARSDRG